MKTCVMNAPYGVTVIQLDNGDEALYLHGENLASADFSERDDAVSGTGERLAAVLNVPYRLLALPVPDNEEWAWNDIVDGLGWGKRAPLSRMTLRPVLECCISHITEDDNLLLGDLCRERELSAWLMDSDVGYLIRLEAVTQPLLRLKRYGLSKPARRLIAAGMKRADISMIHFSSVGETLPGVDTFDW